MSTPFIPSLATHDHASMLENLTSHLIAQQQAIQGWIEQAMALLPTPIYTSVDLRHAGFKVSPIDTNVFPGGFNNLHKSALPLAIKAFQNTISQVTAGQRILLVPENLTRNPGYLENITSLQAILTNAGFEVRVGSLLPELLQTRTLTLPSGKTLAIEPLLAENHSVHLTDFSPDLILLNHDLSNHEASFFRNIKQPVLPNVDMGWSSRTKSQHFNFYAQTTASFAQSFDFDPWLITPMHAHCHPINFEDRQDMQELQSAVSDLLEQIKQHYQKNGIAQNPYVAVKANAGTYGMGIMMIHDASELSVLSKKQKKIMTKSKNNRAVSDVIIQEGVPTLETWQDAVAEPVIYTVGRDVVGGFYRLHTSKNALENLNAPGMSFQPMPCPLDYQTTNLEPNDPRNRFYMYKIISQLTMIAAAKEAQAIKNQDNMSCQNSY